MFWFSKKQVLWSDVFFGVLFGFFPETDLFVVTFEHFLTFENHFLT